MGGLFRGYQTVILEGGAGTGSVIVLPGAETVMIVKAPPASKHHDIPTGTGVRLLLSPAD